MPSGIQAPATSTMYHPDAVGLFLTQDDCCFSRVPVGRRKEGPRDKGLPTQTSFSLIGKGKAHLKAPPQEYCPGLHWPELCHLAIPREQEAEDSGDQPINAKHHHHCHWSRKMSRRRAAVGRGTKKAEIFMLCEKVGSSLKTLRKTKLELDLYYRKLTFITIVIASETTKSVTPKGLV